jgi:uncharacterized protein YjbI with pentapeptide repeats
MWWASLWVPAKVAVVALCIAFVVAFAALVLKWAPEWLATDGAKDKGAELGRTRTAVLASLAGLIAVVGAMFTGLSYRLNRAGQITERFTRAIDQLGHSELDVRLGGIYALERIARDSKDDHPQVVEVLTAYVREHARWSPGGSQPASSEKPDVQLEAIHALIAATRALERIAAGSHAEPDAVGGEPPGEPPPSDHQTEAPDLPTDVQAAMTVLGRRDPSRDRAGAPLNLARTDLRRVVLAADEANLQGALLTEANLQDAFLSGANLERAYLGGANLQDAWLSGANLRGARLRGANLHGAYLSTANLQGAGVTEANLERAILTEANLEGASLNGANLQDTNLSEANLQDTNLTDANLERAFLTDANLEGANLTGANLQGALLTEANLHGASLGGANLHGAVWDAATTWPTADFNPEARGAGPVQEYDERGSAARPDPNA